MSVDLAKARLIFAEAVENFAPPQWSKFLEHACGADQELRQRVEMLLKAHQGEDSFLDRGEGEEDPSLARTRDQTGREEPGNQIGPYKLLQAIGEGGMGTVWMAEQHEPVRRRVAIKLIKAGMDSRQVLARFEAERQALSMMDHPNIAKVLDAGTTDSGRPCFVMELVKGQPITAYCDEHRLSPRERLELFLPVCHAIQHAHQKGIIHRDIKPSNVLVAEYDGRPVAKVIDFGVAKATHQPLTEKTMFTGLGQIIGTLEYMSPEQARVNQLDIDTRSDVYSLGVLLYELLTGSTPFDRKRMREAALDELLRIIREEEPPRPSTKLSSSDTLPSIAANRKTEPARLSTLLRGELDWIVMKALEKDRNRRYETANGFAMDIQRYLNDEAVLACPPSAGYRFRKFARKNKALLATTALVSAALVLGLIGTTWQAYRATRAEQLAVENEERALENEQQALAERDEKELARREIAAHAEAEREARLEAQAERERALAAAEAERLAKEEEVFQRRSAEAISDFLVNDFLALTSIEGQSRFNDFEHYPLSRNTTLRDLLQRAAEKLDVRDDLEPRIEARLRWIIGVSYRALGEAQKAIPFLERAHRLFVDIEGNAGDDALHAANSLAVAYSSAGNLDKALSLSEQLLELSKTELDHDSPLSFEIIRNHSRNRAEAYKRVGQLNKAMVLYEETLERFKSTLGPEHAITLRSMHDLACTYLDAGQWNMALALQEQTLELAEATLGSKHPDTLTIMGNLAVSYQAIGRSGEAIVIRKQVLELEQEILGPQHPSTLISMLNLAVAYERDGQFENALPLLEEAYERMEVQMGPDHPATLSAIRNLSVLCKNRGQLGRAVSLAEHALERSKATLGPDHPQTLVTMNDLALALTAANRRGEAIALHQQTLALRQDKLGEDHPATLASVTNLGTLLAEDGELDRALPLLEYAFERANAKLGRHHPMMPGIINCLAFAYGIAERHDEAIPLLEEAVVQSKALLGRDHPDTLVRLFNLAAAHTKSGGIDQALPLWEETLELQKAKLGPDHPDTLNTMNQLALASSESGHLDKAITLHQQTLELRRAALGPEHPATLASMNNLAGDYFRSGQVETARRLEEETLNLKRKILGSQHASTLMTVGGLALTYRAEQDWDRAIPLFVEWLEYKIVKQGADHPDTLTTMADLARAYYATEQWEESIRLFEQMVGIQKAKLGREHPDTLTSMSNLAAAYKAAKQFARALPLYEETLEQRKVNLGFDDPDTLKSMHQLALAYFSAGDVAKAVPVGEQTLELMKSKLGLEHSETLSCMGNLVAFYRTAGDVAKALPLAEQTLELLKSKLGPEDPNTLTSMQNLSLYYREAGDHDAAVRTAQAALSLPSMQSPSDPEALKRKASFLLAAVSSLNPLGRSDEAESMAREAVAIRQEVLPDDWGCFTALSLLGESLLGQGKLTEAEPLLIQGYAGVKARADQIPASYRQKRLQETHQRLVKLYETWGKPAEAARWQQDLSEFTASSREAQTAETPQ